jgi:hypothetical protein
MPCRLLFNGFVLQNYQFGFFLLVAGGVKKVEGTRGWEKIGGDSWRRGRAAKEGRA